MPRAVRRFRPGIPIAWMLNTPLFTKRPSIDGVGRVRDQSMGDGRKTFRQLTLRRRLVLSKKNKNMARGRPGGAVKTEAPLPVFNPPIIPHAVSNICHKFRFLGCFSCLVGIFLTHRERASTQPNPNPNPNPNPG